VLVDQIEIAEHIVTETESERNPVETGNEETLSGEGDNTSEVASVHDSDFTRTDDNETKYEDTETDNNLGLINTSESCHLNDCDEVKVGDIISYKIPETGVSETSKVISRAAKSTGPNK
jgi:hypothetical protein